LIELATSISLRTDRINKFFGTADGHRGGKLSNSIHDEPTAAYRTGSPDTGLSALSNMAATTHGLSRFPL
jgi:hypothetical protein